MFLLSMINELFFETAVPCIIKFIYCSTMELSNVKVVLKFLNDGAFFGNLVLLHLDCLECDRKTTKP